MDYEIETKLKNVDVNHDDKIDPEVNELIESLEKKSNRKISKAKMMLPWTHVMSTSTGEKTIKAYVFGPIVRIEEIEHAIYINCHNFFIFNNHRYQTESELIKAVDKAAKK